MAPGLYGHGRPSGRPKCDPGCGATGDRGDGGLKSGASITNRRHDERRRELAKDLVGATGIQWEKPLDYSTDGGECFQFLGQPVQNVATLLGLENFLKAYDILDKVGAAKISNHESFESWKLSIPMPSSDDGQVCPYFS